MSESYERERQNNNRLDALAGKVSALRGVTVDIYDSARDHTLIDSSTEGFSSLSQSLRGSAGRLGRAAQSGNKVAILKLAGIVVAVGIVGYWVVRLLWGWLVG